MSADEIPNIGPAPLMQVAPTGPVLRPYQLKLTQDIAEARAEGRKRFIATLPTGGGKTVVAAAVIGQVVECGGQVLFLTHRIELTKQAQNRFWDVGIDAGIIQAGFPMRLGQPVQIASIQTLTSRAVRTRTIEMPAATVVFADECQHTRSPTWQEVLALFPDAVIIGLTATPCRADGRGLGNIFTDGLIEGPTISELVEQGYLVPAVCYAPTRPDLAGVPARMGDYVEDELAERMDRPKLVGDIVEHWLRLGDHRRTVVFATNVSHNLHLRDSFREANVACEHIDASTPADERAQILAKLKAGSIDMVINCMVLTEGWDEPEVSCAILARPTKSMPLYRQMVGRVLRPYPGKANAIILDHAGAVFQHGLIEEPIRWSLSTDHRAENPTHSARARGEMPGLTTCPECHAIRTEGRPCPVCGWRPRPKPVAVAVAAGELGRVDQQRNVHGAKPTAEQMHKFHRELLWVAQQRGYKPGWAAHQYKEKFGVWPPDRSAPPPMPPTPSTLAWVRSRQIAYAKAMEAQR